MSALDKVIHLWSSSSCTSPKSNTFYMYEYYGLLKMKTYKYNVTIHQSQKAVEYE